MHNTAAPPLTNFDLVRISRARPEVGFCANTIRTYGKHGLRLFKVGKVVLFSRSELASLITSGVLATAMRNAGKSKGIAR